MARRFGLFAIVIAAALSLGACAGQKQVSVPKAETTAPTTAKPGPHSQVASLTTGLPKPGEAATAPAIELSEADFECLAQAVYFEAGGESEAGQRAVAAVIMNRVKSGRFPDKVCDVIHEAYKGTCQFSWWCDGKSDEPRDADRWTEAQAAARDVLAGGFVDRTHGALFFHANYVRPRWSKKLQKTAAIGNHIFYR